MAALAEPYIDEAFRALAVDEASVEIRFRTIIRQTLVMYAAGTSREEALRYLAGLSGYLQDLWAPTSGGS
jgi:uncharacterized membrane protein